MASWVRRAAALLLFAGLAGLAQADCDRRASVPAAERSLVQSGRAETRSVDLPDHLPLGWRAPDRTTIRYRIDVAGCAGGNAALWLYRVGAPYVLRTDLGQPLPLISVVGRPLSGSRQDAQAVHNGRVPVLYAIPQGTRAVDIELLAPPYIPAGLVRAEIGPTEQLLPAQAQTFDDDVAFVDVSSGVVLVLGALAFLLWTARRSDRSLLWLAIACGTWGVRGVIYTAPVLPLPPALFEQLNPLQVMLTAAALAASLLALLGVEAPRPRHWLWGTALACVLAMACTTLAERGTALTRALNFFAGFSMVCASLALVWRRRAQLARWHLAVFLAGFAGLVGCAFHDLLMVSGGVRPDSPSYVFWGFVVLLLCFATVSGQYVVLTLNRAERANEELEASVRRKARELEQSYALLRESERDAARTQERERLLRDMHDGLGAQLVTMLRGVERQALGTPQLRQSLQDSIEELRMLMDSADFGHYLPGALATWRNRWDRRLEAAGVTLEWHIGEGLDDVQLSADSTLQVMRILQEAATNIVKHAHAQRMELLAEVVHPEGGPHLRIAIRDDGVGLAAGPHPGNGRGLSNMRQRAGQLGATLEIGPRSGGPGTQVVLELPLAADQATSPRRAASIAASARDEMPSLR